MPFPPLQREQQMPEQEKKNRGKEKQKEQRRGWWWQQSDDDNNRTSDNEDGAPGAAWKVAEATRCFSNGATYLALAIVPPRPLVTQTNKTARTYHRGAVSDLGLDAAIFLKLDQVIERIPWPRAGQGNRSALINKSVEKTKTGKDMKTMKEV